LSGKTAENQKQPESNSPTAEGSRKAVLIHPYWENPVNGEIVLASYLWRNNRGKFFNLPEYSKASF
jgi:hypothetical protein